MKPHDWLNERILLNEVPEHAAKQAEQLHALPANVEKLAELEADNQKRLQSNPAPKVAQSIHHRLTQKPAATGVPAWIKWAPPIAISGLLIALLPWINHNPTDPQRSSAFSKPQSMQIPVTLESPKDSVPSKIVAGSTPSKELTVSAEPLPANSDVRVRGNDDFQALILSDNGETAPASSQISVADRIRIVVPEKPFAAVYSYDTQGVLTQHWPMTGAFARPLPAGPLPHDWQADSLTHRETFVLVYSNASFPLDTNVQSLKQRLRTESTRLKRATFTLTCQP